MYVCMCMTCDICEMVWVNGMMHIRNATWVCGYNHFVEKYAYIRETEVFHIMGSIIK